MEQSPAERPEVFARNGFAWTRDQFEAVLSDTEDYVREKPAQSLLLAFVAGYVLNRLPVGRILGGLFHFLVVALRPAILIYGATKLYHAAQEGE